MLAENLKKFQELLLQNILEFFQNTSIHGLKYVGSSNFYRIQRTFFGVSFIVAFILASAFITKTYDKWMRNPTIVGINPKPNFITNDPFPAVTICNMNRVMKSRVEHISKESADSVKLRLVCNFPNDNYVETGQQYNGRDIIGFLANVSQPCENMILFCRFGGFVQNCSELFNFIVTSQGVCCVFNMLHPKFMFTSLGPHRIKSFKTGNLTPVNWNAEEGYQKDLPKTFSPRLTHGSGESAGLTVILNLDSNNYYCSSAYSKGFRILLHSPNETPNVQELGFLLDSGKQTKIRIRPEKTQTHERLRSMKWYYRYCLFQNEYRLKYFAHYTQRNCEMECIADEMFKYCGCIEFYLPLIYKNIPICNINKTQCAESVRLRTDSPSEYCLYHCLPSCNDLTFYGDVSNALLASNVRDIIDRNYTDEYVKQNIAAVNIYFKEFFFRSSIQDEYIGTADFMANIGGIMGLCLGFSFISILELFFYAFLRPIQSLLKNRGDTKTKSLFKHSTNTYHTQGRLFYSKRLKLKQRLWLDYARYSLRHRSATKGSLVSNWKKRILKQNIKNIIESMPHRTQFEARHSTANR